MVTITDHVISHYTLHNVYTDDHRLRLTVVFQVISRFLLGLLSQCVPDERLWGQVAQVFCKPGVLPVTKPTVSKRYTL